MFACLVDVYHVVDDIVSIINHTVVIHYIVKSINSIKKKKNGYRSIIILYALVVDLCNNIVVYNTFTLEQQRK